MHVNCLATLECWGGMKRMDGGGREGIDEAKGSGEERR